MEEKTMQQLNLYYKQSETEAELRGILALQKENLLSVLSEAEIQSQGFVTVNHRYLDLEKLNEQEKHLIAKDGDKVVAYVLAMTEHSQFQIPVLVPMFELFRQIPFKGKMISDYLYMVVGQVCVAKGYRGCGVFDKAYAEYKRCFEQKYDFAITEIASANTRSLHTHKKVGFKVIWTYTSPDGVEWHIVLWDWREEID